MKIKLRRFFRIWLHAIICNETSYQHMSILPWWMKHILDSRVYNLDDRLIKQKFLNAYIYNIQYSLYEVNISLHSG